MLKFNGGEGAVICDRCRTIFVRGVDPNKCERFKPKAYCGYCKRYRSDPALRDLLKKFKAGWTLHLWRGTTPSNHWMESPKGRKEVQIDGTDSNFLRRTAKVAVENGTVYAPGIFFTSQNGLPEHTIFVYETYVPNNTKGEKS